MLKTLPESKTQVKFGIGDVSANLGKYNLKESLMGFSKSKPVLSISKDDLSTIVKGKSPSKNFIAENRKELQKYLNEAVKSEDNMLGYLEFSHQS